MLYSQRSVSSYPRRSMSNRQAFRTSGGYYFPNSFYGSPSSHTSYVGYAPLQKFGNLPPVYGPGSVGMNVYQLTRGMPSLYRSGPAKPNFLPLAQNTQLLYRPGFTITNPYQQAQNTLSSYEFRPARTLPLLETENTVVYRRRYLSNPSNSIPDLSQGRYDKVPPQNYVRQIGLQKATFLPLQSRLALQVVKFSRKANDANDANEANDVREVNNFAAKRSPSVRREVFKF